METRLQDEPINRQVKKYADELEKCKTSLKVNVLELQLR